MQLHLFARERTLEPGVLVNDETDLVIDETDIANDKPTSLMQ